MTALEEQQAKIIADLTAKITTLEGAIAFWKNAATVAERQTRQ